MDPCRFALLIVLLVALAYLAFNIGASGAECFVPRIFDPATMHPAWL